MMFVLFILYYLFKGFNIVFFKVLEFFSLYVFLILKLMIGMLDDMIVCGICYRVYLLIFQVMFVVIVVIEVFDLQILSNYFLGCFVDKDIGVVVVLILVNYLVVF